MGMSVCLLCKPWLISYCAVDSLMVKGRVQYNVALCLLPCCLAKMLKWVLTDKGPYLSLGIWDEHLKA